MELLLLNHFSVTFLPGIIKVLIRHGLLSPSSSSSEAIESTGCLYRLAVEEVPEEDYMLPLSEAEVIREGSDITLVGWGAQLSVMDEACADAEKAPVARVCGLNTPFPLVFEPFYMPNKNKVLDAIKATVNY